MGVVGLLVEVLNGSFEYSPKSPIFRNLNFNVDKGEILSILGPNGCGKTTLLKCLLGMLDLKEGEIRMNGEDMRKHKGGNSLDIGYVPQSHEMVFPYSVLDMVLMGRARYICTFSMPTSKDVRIAKESLKMVGINRLEGKAFSEISGGEKQLVLIARALTSEAKILMFDEPTSALDYKNQYLIIEMLHKLTYERGLTVITTTHHPEHALYMSDKVLLMNGDGENSIFGDADVVLNEENLKRIYRINVKFVSIQHGESYLKGIIPVLNLNMLEENYK